MRPTATTNALKLKLKLRLKLNSKDAAMPTLPMVATMPKRLCRARSANADARAEAAAEAVDDADMMPMLMLQPAAVRERTD